MSGKSDTQVHIPVEHLMLAGDLVLPEEPRGIIVFAHGSGSSRHSPRNRQVAAALHDAHFATLLMDLLTPEEERLDVETAALRFDIPLLSQRLLHATWWLEDQSSTAKLRLGYFGASTGAAAALVAASEQPDLVDAIVSRGGRADMAGDRLEKVITPTLLIVGGQDAEVLDHNRQALNRLSAISKNLHIVPGARHLFEEPGALHEVATVARDWFERFLAGSAGRIEAA